MQFSNFAIEYLCESKNVRETVFECSHVAQIEYLKQKMVENSGHCRFNLKLKNHLHLHLHLHFLL